MRRAIFPGSFDPLTLGHYDIIKRGITLFDELIIAIGINADKKYMFSLEERQKFIEEAFADEPKIKVLTYMIFDLWNLVLVVCYGFNKK